MTLYALLRRTCQILTCAGFLLLPWLPPCGVLGSLFALDFFGLPFADPVGACTLLFQGAFPLRLLAGALASLMIALLLGRVFCSFICPYGLASELVHALRKRAHVLPWPRPFLLKSGVLLAALLLGACTGLPFTNLLSFAGQLSLAPLLVAQHADILAVGSLLLLPLLTLLLEAYTGTRLWCRYLCPQSVLLGLAAWAQPKSAPALRFFWNPTRCTCKGTSPCNAACSMGLTPRHVLGVSRRDCTQCGDCLKVCAQHGGALRFRLSPTPPKAR